jgi:hypothetical protein
MFRRLIFDNWVAIFPLISMIVTVVVYATITWYACRMKKPQITHLETLPLADDNNQKKPDHASPRPIAPHHDPSRLTST